MNMLMMLSAAGQFFKTKLGKITLVAAIGALCLIADNYRDNKAEKEAYERGYTSAMAEVVRNNQVQSERIAGSLQAIFNKHTQSVMNSLREDKEQRDEIAKLLQTGVYVSGNCHEPVGVGLLNEQIRSRRGKQNNAARIAE